MQALDLEQWLTKQALDLEQWLTKQASVTNRASHQMIKFSFLFKTCG
jgi:hypothetical protein